MKLRTPRQTTWWIALALGLIGVLIHIGVLRIGGLGEFAFWAVAIGLGLLLVGTRIRGL
jgi:hypothetical protein